MSSDLTQMESTFTSSDRGSLSDLEICKPQSPSPSAKPRRYHWSKSSTKPRPHTKCPEKRSAREIFHRIVPGHHTVTQAVTHIVNDPVGGISVSEVIIGQTLELPISRMPSPNASASSRELHGVKSKWLPHIRKVSAKDTSVEPAPRVPALEGESIVSRHRIDTASIEGDFHRIEYGQFKGKPACLIIVDLRLAYQPSSTIKGMRIEFQFGKDSKEPMTSPTPTQTTTATYIPPISKNFYPDELVGETDYSKIKKHSNIKPEIGGMSFKVSTGGGGSHVTTTKQHRWRVQGRTEEHNGVYDTFGWRIFENTESENSVPRKVRLGMVAFHEHQPFWVETTVEGSLRKNNPFTRASATRGKKWFYPPSLDERDDNVLDAEDLEDQVSRYNMLIEGVALRTADRQHTVNQINLIDVGGMNGGGRGSGITGTRLGSGAHDLLELTTGDNTMADVRRTMTQRTLRNAPEDVPEEDAASIVTSAAASVASMALSGDDDGLDTIDAIC